MGAHQFGTPFPEEHAHHTRTAGRQESSTCFWQRTFSLGYRGSPDASAFADGRLPHGASVAAGRPWADRTSSSTAKGRGHQLRRGGAGAAHLSADRSVHLPVGGGTRHRACGTRPPRSSRAHLPSPALRRAAAHLGAYRLCPRQRGDFRSAPPARLGDPGVRARRRRRARGLQCRRRRDSRRCGSSGFTSAPAPHSVRAQARAGPSQATLEKTQRCNFQRILPRS